jgi:hypothetical protein
VGPDCQQQKEEGRGDAARLGLVKLGRALWAKMQDGALLLLLYFFYFQTNFKREFATTLKNTEQDQRLS